jgi:hypothetical protein
MRRVGRRAAMRLLAGTPLLSRFARAEDAGSTLDTMLLSFIERVPAAYRYELIDDAKLLTGWVADAAALAIPYQAGELVDRSSGFHDVPGAAAPTQVDGLAGRYRLLANPYERHDYFGMLFGLLGPDDTVVAAVLVNRLFRLPVIVQEPLGLATDIYTNAGLLIGFRTAALDAALAFADFAAEQAVKLAVPLIATGQSQAGGTAQLQIAHLMATTPQWRGEGAAGFVTFNGTCTRASVRRLGVDPARLPGVNFAKDLDPMVGPHTLLANRIGLQIYIHADGTAGLKPQSSYLRAVFHPHEHFLDSFSGLPLGKMLKDVSRSS